MALKLEKQNWGTGGTETRYFSKDVSGVIPVFLREASGERFCIYNYPLVGLILAILPGVPQAL
jgi:hypothetical protein